MTEVWGILNVTPDSFSDGGRYVDAGAAIAHARRMRAQGADVIDVGGESTRPGATPITPDEEQERILPVISELVREGLTVSVDTVHASTAAAAIEAGAAIVNDVTAGLHDPDMLATVARTDAKIVLMHSRGIDVLADTNYVDIVGDVMEFLAERIEAAEAAGISLDRIILDPGFGFSKEPADNWRLLSALRAMSGPFLPILVGTSRKRFLGALLPEGAEVTDRDIPTAATSLLAAQQGAAAVRVHDVASTVAALKVLEAVQEHENHADDDFGSIRIDGIAAVGYHGVLEHERVDGQRFLVDVELSGPFRKAGRTDTLAHTVNYAEVAEAVVRVIEGEPVQLIETLAERVADACLEFSLVDSVFVTVHKPQAPIGVPFGDVTVSVSRMRDGL